MTHTTRAHGRRILSMLMAFVLNMQAVMAEYAEMTRAALIAFAVLCNVTMLLHDIEA